MSLVHAYHKVIKLRQHIRKGSAERFLKLVEIELHIRLTVEYLSDIKNEELYLGGLFYTQRHLLKFHGICIVILAVINFRLSHFRFKPLEDILRMIRIGFLAELVINRTAGGEDEEMLISLCFVQVIDARSHKTCFPNAGGHCIAERRKVKFRLNPALLFTVFRCGFLNSFLAGFLVITMRTDGVEVGERFLLRSSQTHRVLDFFHYV